MAFFKLQRLLEMKLIITQRINREVVNRRAYSIEEDWDKIVAEHIREKNRQQGIENNADSLDEFEILARREKAEALKVLCNYRVSVLIGPAGSGKTTLLEMFEKLPDIKKGGLIKLAPTGKARVKGWGRAQKLSHSICIPRIATTATMASIASKKMGRKIPQRETSSSMSRPCLPKNNWALSSTPSARWTVSSWLETTASFRRSEQGAPLSTLSVLKPEIFPNPTVRTGPGYAELRQIRRQKKNVDVERKDIVLSRCFGDEPEKGV